MLRAPARAAVTLAEASLADEAQRVRSESGSEARGRVHDILARARQRKPRVFERCRGSSTVEEGGTVLGPTPPTSVEAAAAFETLAQLLVEAAPREMMLRRLGQAVAQTSRQVRALERRVEPALAAAFASMTSLLDEREREEHLRLRHFLRKRRRG
jgi:vacuolar-type H+-ATPase subunit D/Vma8